MSLPLSSQLTPIETAIDFLLQQIKPLQDMQSVDLSAALGRVLAIAQTASINVPYQDNSAMDGYAINTEDLNEGETPLKVSQRIPAGHTGEALQAGTAARIFTGAAIIDGANAVVIQENCRVCGDEVVVLKNAVPGENIRPKGQDIAAGSTILPAGKCLQAQDVGLLASIGVCNVKVLRRLKVAILTTGDEIVEPGEALAEGQVYNSNYYTLAALVSGLGMESINLGIVKDCPEATEQALSKAMQQADCVISSGGVSVGEEDHVKSCVEKLGELSLWKLAIKPGKPFAFGTLGGKLGGKLGGRQGQGQGQVPFFGLPGNPVAGFIAFILLVKPCLLRQQGCRPKTLHTIKYPANFSKKRASNRQEYVRVQIEKNSQGQPQLNLYPNQSSGVLSSLSWAHGLAVIPPETQVDKGVLLEYIALADVGN